tara:strand:+ start:943 stop:1125 length:183 start_codon:yes stop_codon:yes gene_type:complete
MAEKEIAYISFGVIIFIFIVFFSLLLYTLGDRSVYNIGDKPSGLLELREEEALVQNAKSK